MKEMRESGDILKSLKELTNQQNALTNEIMRLKRELAGRPVVSAGDCTPANINPVTTTATAIATATTENNTSTATKKRGRGRPKKDVETVSSLAPICHEFTININNSQTMRYVLEGGELFLHDPINNRLFDTETRSAVGRYNLYLDRIDWL